MLLTKLALLLLWTADAFVVQPSSRRHVPRLFSSEVSTDEPPSEAPVMEDARKSVARERYTLFVGNIPFGESCTCVYIHVEREI
jgi:hypothetical protein